MHNLVSQIPIIKQQYLIPRVIKKQTAQRSLNICVCITTFQKLDLAHRKTDANCIHRKDNAPKPLGPIISKL